MLSVKKESQMSKAIVIAVSYFNDMQDRLAELIENHRSWYPVSYDNEQCSCDVELNEDWKYEDHLAYMIMSTLIDPLLDGKSVVI